MIKYRSEDYLRFHSIKVPDEKYGKWLIYFKRIPETDEVDSSDNLYASLNNFIKFPETQHPEQQKSSQKMDNGDVPKSRTLIIMNFDQMFDRKHIAKVFKLCGMLRRVFVGQIKLQEENKKKKQIFVGMVVFKNEYDLTKAFNIEYFQYRINQKFLAHNSEALQNYGANLIKNFEVVDDEKNLIVQDAQKDGFKIVTNKQGNFQVNFDNPVFKKQNWTGRNKKKPKQELLPSELDDVILGMDDKIPKQKKKDILQSEKRKLIQEFEEDRQKLKQIKTQ